jgi:hypothetical protein
MDPNKLPGILYYVVMAIALCGWAALIFFPRRPRFNFWFAGLWVPLALCLIYMYMLIAFWFVPPVGRFSDFLTLDGVYRMFGNHGLLLVGWINLTVMDLVGGAWMTRKAAQVRMPYVWLLPCLILTFVFVGFGFTLFAVINAVGGTWNAIGRVEDVPPTDSAPVRAFPS